MKKLYLVDVSSMFFRAFYAIRPLSTPAGLPTNAIFGFVSMTVKLLREIKPDYMAFCFDRAEPSFRKDLDVRYKANRTEMPSDLALQVPYIRQVSEALGIPCFDRQGFEADDIIGTLTRWGREHDLDVVIVSGDKDFGQLVRPFVQIYDTMKEVRYDEAGVLEKWGVEPRKMRDYLALVGDASDNVPGVRGIGPKGAVKLLSDFDTLEDLYKNVESVESKSTRAKLVEGKDEAFLSQKLVTIVEDIPLDICLDDLRLRTIHRNELHALFVELDFKNFARTLLGEVTGSLSSAAAGISSSANLEPSSVAALRNTSESSPLGAAFGAGSEASAPATTSPRSSSPFVRVASAEMKAHVAASLAQAGGLKSAPPLGEEQSAWKDERQENQQERANGRSSAAIADNSANRQQPIIEPGRGLIEIGPIEEVRMNLAQVDEWLQPNVATWGFHSERGVILAQGDTVAEIAGNWAELGVLLSQKNLCWKGFDLKTFWKAVGLKVPSAIQKASSSPLALWDQMLAAYVVRAGSIDEVGPLFTRYVGVSLPELPSPAQLYTAHLRLEFALKKKLATVNGERVLNEIELPLIPVLFEMEHEGIRIDRLALETESGALTRDIQAIEKEIHADAGEVFNVSSPKQLGHILFEKLKMPTGKKTKTGYSTDTDVLMKLAPQYPICAKVVQYRELTKLKSTYVDALPALADRESGRVHTTFNQAQTATGRLSSTNPNLQNIPIRTERGARIRKAFIANEGEQLVTADYSQIELRILAHITNDSGLMRAFAAGTDIHTATASEVFSVAVTDVTPEMRRKAKAVNFGLAYGQGPFGLAGALRISRSEATEIIGRYFERFSGVRQYMDETIETAKKQGFVETIFGRRRYLDELRSGSSMVRKFGERAAINAPIQGAASDIVKKAMIECYKRVPAKMLLQVHDELVFETTKDEVMGLLPVVREVMENTVALKVPLDVNVGAGINWDAAHS